MGLGEKVSDWQVCAAMQVAMANVIGAGLFMFDFYSKSADVCARFWFEGGGVGAGGNASGTAIFEDIGKFGPWTSIECDEPFSVWDLNGAWGRMSCLGMGQAVLFGIEYITAAPPWSMWRSYFHSQNVGGFTYGIGGKVGGYVLVGNWKFKNVCKSRPTVSNGDPNIA